MQCMQLSTEFSYTCVKNKYIFYLYRCVPVSFRDMDIEGNCFGTVANYPYIDCSYNCTMQKDERFTLIDLSRKRAAKRKLKNVQSTKL